MIFTRQAIDAVVRDSPGLVALRVHDGVHANGFCVFSLYDINIVGRFV